MPLFPFSFWNAAIKINIKYKILGLELLLVRVLGGKFIATLLCFARNLLMHQSGEVCVFFIKMLHSINLGSREDTGGHGAQLSGLSLLMGRSVCPSKRWCSHSSQAAVAVEALLCFVGLSFLLLVVLLFFPVFLVFKPPRQQFVPSHCFHLGSRFAGGVTQTYPPQAFLVPTLDNEELSWVDDP